MIPVSSSTRKPRKITYEFDDGVIEEYVLTTITRAGAPTQRSGKKTHSGGGDTSQVPDTLLPQPTEAVIAAGRYSAEEVRAPQGPGQEEGTDGTVELAASRSPSLQSLPSHPCCCCALCRPEKCKDINNSTNPRIGSPGPVTLFAFGMTTCLYNVHVSQICPMNMTTMGLIVFYGGLAQFVGGWFELINKNAFFCTLDVTYGAFWMATAVTNLVPENNFVTTTDVSNKYMGGFFMFWFFFSSTMFVSSLAFGTFVQMLLNFSVALNFLLNLLGQFTNSNTLQKVAGFEGIVEGCLAVYVGMAFTLREAYGHSILPLLFQKNFHYTEW